MKVRARWNVKDGNGWHSVGEVFETESNLGDAVEVLEAPKKPEPARNPVPAKAPEKAPEKAAAASGEMVRSRRRKADSK